MAKPKISLSVKSGDKVQKIADDINNLSPAGRALAVAAVDALAGNMLDHKDIFYWANQTVSVIEELGIELFLINKNNVPYRISYHKDLERQFRPLFIDDMMEAVFSGAETGMAVRHMETTNGEQNVLDFIELEKVPRAAELLTFITDHLNDVVEFSHDEHDINRMVGIVARFTPPKGKDSTGPFYVFKLLQSSHIIAGSRSWALEPNGFKPMPAQATVRVTPDNQMLLLDGMMYAFNVTKFNKLFKYDAKREVKVSGKIAEIEQHFKLSFPDGVTLKSLIDANPALGEKLLRADPANVDQDKMIETADEFQLALMQDDNGAFIIMDKRDAMMFANLLNDSYVESNTTGTHYLAEKKKEVSAAEDAQVNLGV